MLSLQCAAREFRSGRAIREPRYDTTRDTRDRGDGGAGGAGKDRAVPARVRPFMDPTFYPHRPSSVELTETHISWVFLAGEYVYKVKKPSTSAFSTFGPWCDAVTFAGRKSD